MEKLILKSRLAAQPAYQSPCWNPSVDVYRTDEAWLLKFDLAGVDPGDLCVAIEGRRVTVSGERRDWAVTQRCRTYQMEIAYNRFARSVELPVELDPRTGAHEYLNGMLLITVRPLCSAGD